MEIEFKFLPSKVECFTCVLSTSYNSVYNHMKHVNIKSHEKGVLVEFDSTFNHAKAFKDSLMTVSVSDEDIIIPYDMIAKLPHEAVGNFLFGQCTDVQLPKHLFENEIPHLTPDFCYHDPQENVLWVIELKTYKYDSKSAFKNGLGSYNFSGLVPKIPVVFSSIGVSLTGLTHSKTLSITNHQTVISIYQMCVKIKELSENLKPHLKKELSLPKIQLKTGPLMIDDFHIEKWSNSNNPKTLSKSINYFSGCDIEWKTKIPMHKGLHPPSKITNLPILKVTKKSKIPGLDVIKTLHALGFNVVAKSLDEYAHTFYNGYGKRRFIRYPITMNEGIDEMMDSIKRGLWASIITGESDTSVLRNHDAKKRKKLMISVDNHRRERAIAMIEQHKKKRARVYRPGQLNIQTFGTTFLAPSEGSKENYQTRDISGQGPKIYGEAWEDFSLFIERYIEELNIARLLGGRKWNYWMIQKIDPYDAYIISKSTGYSSHVFHYLFYHGETILKTFDTISIGNWHCSSHVLSMKEVKLRQYLGLYERLSSLRFFFSERYDDWRCYMTHSILMALDGKQTTIDYVSLFRYINMQALSGRGSDGMKSVLSKLENPIRTAYQAHIVDTMIKIIGRGSKVSIEEEDGVFQINDLTNWVTHSPMKNIDEIVQSSYMHYVIPHPAPSGLKPLLDITKKLITEEKKLDIQSPYLGTEIPEQGELKAHEFDYEFVVAVGRKIRKILDKRSDMNYIISTWKEEMRNTSYNDFATFKKSTNQRDPPDRSFCYEEVLKILDDKKSPYESEWIKHYLNDNDKRVKVTIFPKDQTTGTREIFVLEMKTRICVKANEMLARIINKHLDCEMLSKPEDKLTRNLHHRRLVNSKICKMRSQHDDKEIYTMDFVNSSDAKTWCQQFVMRIFGALWTGILGQCDELNFICSILNLITQKEIHVSKFIKLWREKNPDVLVNSDITDLLEILKNTSHPMHKNGGIRNLSNMMQGIPHEQSSMLHAGILSAMLPWLEKFASLKLKKILPNCEISMIATGKASSDDSSKQLTLVVACDPKDWLEASRTCRKIMYRICYIVERVPERASILLNPVKSTLALPASIEEFNSCWCFRNKIVPATIKFMTSCFSMGYHPSLFSRVSEGHSSIMNMLQNGARLNEIHNTSLLLQRYHRRMLYGNNGDHLSSDTWNTALSKNIVGMGVLTVAPKGLCGLLSLEETLYLAQKIGKEVHTLSEGYGGRKGDIKTLRMFIERSTTYRRCMNRLGVNRDRVNNILKANPEKVLSMELPERVKIEIKLLSPGASISMGRVTETKILAASRHLYNKPEDGLEFHVSNTQPVLFSKLRYIDDIWEQYKELKKVPREVFEGPVLVRNYCLNPCFETIVNVRSSVLKYLLTGDNSRMCRTSFSYAKTMLPYLEDTWTKTIDNLQGDVCSLLGDLSSLDEVSPTVNFLMGAIVTHEPLFVTRLIWRTSWSENFGMSGEELKSTVKVRNHWALSADLRELSSAWLYGPTEIRDEVWSDIKDLRVKTIDEVMPIERSEKISWLLCAAGSIKEGRNLNLMKFYNYSDFELKNNTGEILGCMRGHPYFIKNNYGVYSGFKPPDVSYTPSIIWRANNRFKLELPLKDFYRFINVKTKEIEVRVYGQVVCSWPLAEPSVQTLKKYVKSDISLTQILTKPHSCEEGFWWLRLLKSRWRSFILSKIKKHLGSVKISDMLSLAFKRLEIECQKGIESDESSESDEDSSMDEIIFNEVDDLDDVMGDVMSFDDDEGEDQEGEDEEAEESNEELEHEQDDNQSNQMNLDSAMLAARGIDYQEQGVAQMHQKKNTKWAKEVYLKPAANDLEDPFDELAHNTDFKGVTSRQVGFEATWAYAASQYLSIVSRYPELMPDVSEIELEPEPESTEMQVIVEDVDIEELPAGFLLRILESKNPNARKIEYE